MLTLDLVSGSFIVVAFREGGTELLPARLPGGRCDCACRGQTASPLSGNSVMIQIRKTFSMNPRMQPHQRPGHGKRCWFRADRTPQAYPWELDCQPLPSSPLDSMIQPLGRDSSSLQASDSAGWLASWDWQMGNVWTLGRWKPKTRATGLQTMVIHAAENSSFFLFFSFPSRQRLQPGAPHPYPCCMASSSPFCYRSVVSATLYHTTLPQRAGSFVADEKGTSTKCTKWLKDGGAETASTSSES